MPPSLPASALPLAKKLLGKSITPALLKGVLHVTAVAVPGGSSGDGAGGFQNIRVHNPEAPRCSEDLFCLNLARSVADVVLTTGSNVRLERENRPKIMLSELERWRSKGGAGSTPSPSFWVLTRGRDLDLSAPFFQEVPTGGEVVLYTSEEGANKLKGSAGGCLPNGVRIMAVPDSRLSLLGALRSAKRLAAVRSADLGGADADRRSGRAAVVSIEAGPSTVKELYGRRLEVDTLLLSQFLGETPDGTTEDQEVLSAHAVRARFGPLCGGPHEVLCDDGHAWRFGLYTRRAR